MIGIVAGLVVGLIGLVALTVVVVRLRHEVQGLHTRFAMRDVPSPAAPVADRALVEGLPPGLPAPPFTLPNLGGGTETLETLSAAHRPIVLIFWNPDALACAALLPEIAGWQRDHASAITVAVIGRGSASDLRAAIGDTAVAHLLVDREGEVAPRYQVWAAPTAVFVHVDGTIGSPLAVGGEAARNLIAMVTGVPTKRITPARTAQAAVFWLRGGHPRKSSFVHDELLPDGSMVLYHSSRQKIMTLNTTGALIWECCDGAHAFSQIVSEVREVFPNAPEIERDVATLLRQMFEQRMIDSVQS
jgi:peroxiredoxin